ncbi:unnamed protein product [Urochloa humidicola]
MESGSGQEEDLTRLLPGDALAGILRRLPHRSLAVSRCVCKAWRYVTDDHRLLLPHLLPHSVGGIFIRYNCHECWEFFARPTTGPTTISSEVDFDSHRFPVEDHCNGLVLLPDCVVNPSTQWRAPLPPRPPPQMGTWYFYNDGYLIFDPSVSLDYEVILIPRISHKNEPGHHLYSRHWDELDPVIEKLEWPPSQWKLSVFSSRTGQWEERSFLREGEAIGTIADIRPLSYYLQRENRYGAHLRGELVVHCEAGFVMRISLSNNTYQVIKPPADAEFSRYEGFYLGKLENKVCCALLDQSRHSRWLRIWFLKETHGRMEWALKHQTNLKLVLARPAHRESYHNEGPWILQNINYYKYCSEDEVVEPENFEWDSDNDNILQTNDKVDGYNEYIDFLGFHPYKEVVFLCETLHRGLAYHLNGSKVQDLGDLFPTNYGHFCGNHGLIRESFPYTPCWIRELPPNNELI